MILYILGVATIPALMLLYASYESIKEYRKDRKARKEGIAWAKVHHVPPYDTV